MNPTLGIDIGGVLIERVNHDKDTSFFGKGFLRTPAVPGAIEAVRRLAQGATFSPSRVCLVSKCGPRVQERTRAWLAHHAFFEETGIPKENLFFCLERGQKAGICRTLGVTHFVDDRLEVLIGMKEVVPHRFLFRPSSSEVREWSFARTNEREAQSWGEIVAWTSEEAR